MKQIILTTLTAALIFTSNGPINADDDITVVAPTSEAADGLDLRVVGELFKESKNLEEFEKSLNDPETGINNLDLDENGEVDYIRIVEEVADETHVIILQSALGEDEFQDVATIEIEKDGDESHNMQVRGNVIIYGADYYVAPSHVHIHTWPIITWMYRPAYHPYRSVYYFGHHPRWWKPYHPVHVNVYHTRTVRYTRGDSFTVTKTSRVKTVSKVNYRSRSSARVTKKTRVTATSRAGNKTSSEAKSSKVSKRKKASQKSGKKATAKGAKKAEKKDGKGKAGARKKAGKKKKKSGAKGAKKKGGKKSGKRKGAKKSGKSDGRL